MSSRLGKRITLHYKNTETEIDQIINQMLELMVDLFWARLYVKGVCSAAFCLLRLEYR